MNKLFAEFGFNKSFSLNIRIDKDIMREIVDNTYIETLNEIYSKDPIHFTFIMYIIYTSISIYDDNTEIMRPIKNDRIDNIKFNKNDFIDMIQKHYPYIKTYMDSFNNNISLQLKLDRKITERFLQDINKNIIEITFSIGSKISNTILDQINSKLFQTLKLDINDYNIEYYIKHDVDYISLRNIIMFNNEWFKSIVDYDVDITQYKQIMIDQFEIYDDIFIKNAFITPYRFIKLCGITCKSTNELKYMLIITDDLYSKWLFYYEVSFLVYKLPYMFDIVDAYKSKLVLLEDNDIVNGTNIKPSLILNVDPLDRLLELYKGDISRIMNQVYTNKRIHSSSLLCNLFIDSIINKQFYKFVHELINNNIVIKIKPKKTIRIKDIRFYLKKPSLNDNIFQRCLYKDDYDDDSTDSIIIDKDGSFSLYYAGCVISFYNEDDPTHIISYDYYKIDQFHMHIGNDLYDINTLPKIIKFTFNKDISKCSYNANNGDNNQCFYINDEDIINIFNEVFKHIINNSVQFYNYIISILNKCNESYMNYITRDYSMIEIDNRIDDFITELRYYYDYDNNSSSNNIYDYKFNSIESFYNEIKPFYHQKVDNMILFG